MSIKLITFDLDDTLWDTAPVIASAEVVLRDWLEANAPSWAGCRWNTCSPSANAWCRPSPA